MKTEMRQVYIAEDGTPFFSHNECRVYEARLQVAHQLNHHGMFSEEDESWLLSWLDTQDTRLAITRYYEATRAAEGLKEAMSQGSSSHSDPRNMPADIYATLTSAQGNTIFGVPNTPYIHPLTGNQLWRRP